MVNLRSSIEREVFRIAFSNVLGYFIILLSVVLVVITFGYFSKNNPLRELFLVQIPLTLLGGFIASYGASIAVTMKERLHVIEKYEGRPYVANTIKIELKPKNVGLNGDIYEFGMDTKEIRIGHVIRDELNVLFDVYNLDVQIPPMEKEEDYFNFDNASIHIGNQEISVFDLDGAYKIKNLSNSWKRLDITITKSNLMQIITNNNDISKGTPITIIVESKSEKGYYLKKDKTQNELLWLTIGYLVVVPTETIKITVNLREFEENGVVFSDSIARRRWRKWSNHWEPFSIAKLNYDNNHKKLTITIGRTNPRLFVGEQLTIKIPLLRLDRKESNKS